jgi:hypothetical protein
MEKQNQDQPEITEEVQSLIGAQLIQIISLQKQIQGLNTMCAAFEQELNELKGSKQVK